MKTKIKMMFVALLLPISSFAQSGVGGSFDDFQANQWIAQVKADLLPILEVSTSHYLSYAKDSRSEAIDALKNIQLSPTVYRTRNGRPLLLDNDRSKNRIFVLGLFYDRFNDTMNSRDAVPKIKRKILHEIGHLIVPSKWDATDLERDEDAEAFAEDVSNAPFLPFVDLNDPSKYCGGVTKIVTSFDADIVKKCFETVQINHCAAGTPTTTASLSEFSKAINQCYYDHYELFSEPAKQREDALATAIRNYASNVPE